MTDQPLDVDRDAWHRRFAAGANDRAWKLSEQSELTVQERSELLDTAHAAAYHWRKIGTEAQVAHAELLLGRTHALLGHGTLAMKYATAAFDSITSRESVTWELAFAHAVLANAAFASGDTQLHRDHYMKAKSLGDSLEGQDKELFEATFMRISKPA